jgi:hypothetical protein
MMVLCDQVESDGKVIKIEGTKQKVWRRQFRVLIKRVLFALTTDLAGLRVITLRSTTMQNYLIYHVRAGGGGWTGYDTESFIFTNFVNQRN